MLGESFHIFHCKFHKSEFLQGKVKTMYIYHFTQGKILVRTKIQFQQNVLLCIAAISKHTIAFVQLISAIHIWFKHVLFMQVIHKSGLGVTKI